MAPTIETVSRLDRALTILNTRLGGLNAPRASGRESGGIVAAPAPRGWSVIETAPETVEAPAPTRAAGIELNADRAYFKLTSVRTGAAFTYKVSAADRGGWFVSVVDSPEAWGQYIGFIGDRDRRFRLTEKSRLSPDAPSVKAWAWTWERFVSGRPVEGVEIERLEARG